MLGLAGCTTSYEDSSIPLIPEYVSEETIDYCKACPTYVREDLAECQAMAAKLDFRNNLDSNNIVKAPDTSWLSILLPVSDISKENSICTHEPVFTEVLLVANNVLLGQNTMTKHLI